MHGGGWWSYLRYDDKQDRPAISWDLIRRAASYGRPYLGGIIGMLAIIIVITLLSLRENSRPQTVWPPYHSLNRSAHFVVVILKALVQIDEGQFRPQLPIGWGTFDLEAPKMPHHPSPPFCHKCRLIKAPSSNTAKQRAEFLFHIK